MDYLFIKALKGENTSGRVPVWFMRQAGRYMPEYRALREKYSFLELCRDPELIVNVTKLPITLINPDAAILFSDILLVTELLGCQVAFDEGTGPILTSDIAVGKPVPSIQKDPKDHLGYVLEAIKVLRRELEVPLIGFAGAPFTLASYVVEGRTSRDFSRTKQWMFEDPKTFHQLLETLCSVVEEYLRLQVEAGAQAIQIFDSWAHCLAYPQFREFCLHYLRRLVSALTPLGVPIVLFCRGSSVFAEELASLRPSGIGIDWNADLRSVRARVGPRVSLQGNLDPQVLLAPVEVAKREARRMLDSMEGDPGYVFNLGHGVLPQTPVDTVKQVVEMVHNARRTVKEVAR